MFTFLTPQNRSLLWQLVITDFKLRYQGSVLGYVWSLLKPLLLFTVLYLVFTYALPLGKDVPHYPAYLLLGVVLWNFFVEATSMGMRSIVDRGELVRKVKISKPSIVIASTLSAAVNLCLNLIIVFVFITLTRAEIGASAAMFPLLLGELVILALGVSFFLSALYVRFRDVAPIWEVVLQIMFYATPIIYPLTMVKSVQLQQLLSLNPLTQIIQDAREVLVTPATLTTHDVLPVWLSYALPLIIIVAVAVIAVIFFRSSAKKFAEDL